uniref:FYVE and coiled-coil domain-containing protein 1 n=1 Tax=Astatotilapia calliptera TaxID=8154 RepID=A0AAX7SXS2_ASTCA
MAAGTRVEENQLQRIIRDLHESVAELAKEYRETGEPITDDSTNLQKFANKLEYLLQFDQKEKTTFLGTKKDYWDYFSECLAKIKGANDGIRFVKSITELKTSLGKGRAFIRYSLVHQRLADTLQQCLMNQRVTSDWYYARSPFLKPHLSVDIISHLYELNEVQFDVASRGYDLDASWPTFARRTLGSANSPGHMWKPPSRSSSINSLASSYSQQASEFLSSPDYGQGLLNDLNESLPACREDVSEVEELRLELDRSELKHRELQDKMQQLGEESEELRGVVVDLQRQLDASLTLNEQQKGLQENFYALQQRETALSREVEALRTGEQAKQAEQLLLQEKLAVAEGKNMELMAKMGGFLNEKDQQTAKSFDSAQKIHELLDRLKEAEKGKLEAVAEVEKKRRQTERLEEELRVKETSAKDAETKLGALLSSVSEEKVKLEEKVEEQCFTVDKLQGALVVKEKEASNLQRQLQDLQRSLEEKEKEVVEVKKRAQEDKDEMQKNIGDLKESLEAEVASLIEQLKRKEVELACSVETLQQLQSKNQGLITERDKLNTRIAELEENVKEQATKIENGKTEYSELEKEMAENRSVLEAELAALRASEKQLRSQLDDTKVTVDEKEKRLREENCKLDESLQRATMAAKLSETTLKRLEQENQSLREEQNTGKAALNLIQADLKNAHGQIGELEKNLGASRNNEASLQEQLQVKEAQLESKETDLVKLQSRLKDLETKEKELEIAKADAEATCAKQSEMLKSVTSEKQVMEMAQLERSAVEAKENQEIIGKLAVVEVQLEVRMKEVSRLQAEVLDLRVQVQRSEEEKLKLKAQLEVTEAQRNELRTLTEQLKSQTEALNQKHVAELVECKKKEEALIEKHDHEVAAHAELAIAAAAMREELSTLKADNRKLALENNEIREGLHRANTEMAELGMTICKLSAEKEEVRGHWEGDSGKIIELEKGVERLEKCMEELQLENNSLRKELTQKEALPQTIVELQEELEKTKNQVQTIKDSNKEEMEAIKFQMSSESMNYQVQIKVRGINVLITTCLKPATAEADKQSSHLKMTAEIDDLNRTKTNLEERLIELLKDKDALWQKSDALEFEQKLRAEERWWLVDQEATNCLDCKGQFTWWLRRHHCRLCGRIFCYYCSNNYVVTKQSGKKERCCRHCYTQHSAVVERFTAAELSPSDVHNTSEAFDIITEEEVNGVSFKYLWVLVLVSSLIINLHYHYRVAVPLSIDDIAKFGESSRELFIKSSSYSVITVAVIDSGPTISWMFSSEPKSIFFSVVYRESTDTPVQQSKVLIPLTRCVSHKETIQGQLKVRHPGLYTLIFDNSFSRFISKKVFYHLTMEKSIIYDGSDCP